MFLFKLKTEFSSTELISSYNLETSNEVPTIMSSLWKKLDHTLSQIRYYAHYEVLRNVHALRLQNYLRSL